MGIVANLSGGRVDLSFGQSWNPDDFVLAPQHYPERLLAAADRRPAAAFAVERYLRANTLCGSVEDCSSMVAELERIGVDEVACLIDFGLPDEDVQASLALLAVLRERHGPG